MAEWIYEAGIGEARAALIENGEIVEARIEREHEVNLQDGMDADRAQGFGRRLAQRAPLALRQAARRQLAVLE